MLRMITMVCLLVWASASSAKTLFIGVITEANSQSFDKYLREYISSKATKNDRYIFLDALTQNILVVGEVDKSRRDKSNFSSPKWFNALEKLRPKLADELYAYNYLETDQNFYNDTAKVLQLVNDIIVMSNDYDEFNISLIGSSHLLQTPDFSFVEGSPSEGFLILDDSPFHHIRPVADKTIRFNVFYDDDLEHNDSLESFYFLLSQKLYGERQFSFNAEVSEVEAKPITTIVGNYPDELRIIHTFPKSPCELPDNITTNFLQKTYEYEITIQNECRAYTEATLRHNVDEQTVKKSKVLFDSEGVGTVRFQLQAGQNVFEYLNVVNVWDAIVGPDIEHNYDHISLDKKPGLDQIEIVGLNTLRREGDKVKITYLNSGISYFVAVVDGKYTKLIDISSGVNRFEIEQMDGTIQEKEFALNESCVDVLTYDEELLENSGDLIGQITNSCRKDGELVQFIYNDEFYYARINNGVARIQIPFYFEKNPVFYVNFEKKTLLWEQFEIPSYKSLVKATIRWQDSGSVDLHVFEPGTHFQRPVDSRYSSHDELVVRRGHMNYKNRTNGIGRINLGNIPSRQELSGNTTGDYYISYTGKFPNTEGEIAFFVDYESRHMAIKGSPPFCGVTARGGMVVSYKVLIAGQLETGELFLNPDSQCKHDPQNQNRISGLAPRSREMKEIKTLSIDE